MLTKNSNSKSIALALSVFLLAAGCLNRESDTTELGQRATFTEKSPNTSTTSEDASDGLWVHSDINIEGTSGGWRFVFGSYEPIGLPLTAFLKLYAVRNDEVVPIEMFQDLHELKGLRVDTPKGAIALVRLLTAEDTYAVFEEPMATEIDLDEAIVSDNESGFLVKRHLVYESDEYKNDYPCFEVTEQVSRDGKYKMIDKCFLRNVSIHDFRRGEFF